MKKILFAVFLIITAGTCLEGQIVIELRKTFIDSIKNKVTLSSLYFIDKAHDSPNSPSEDGDLHVAGRDLKVGLPVVAEIMNAKKAGTALTYIHGNEGSGKPVTLTGAWRIWCEHATSNEEQFIQGTAYQPFKTTNPPHVFEFHPVTMLPGIDLSSTLVAVSGYKYKDADMAFTRFSNVSFNIESKGEFVKMTTSGVGFNYIRFRMELTDSIPFMVDDGAFAFVKILNLENHIINYKVRTAYVKNSAPYNKLMKMKKGDIMDVVGIPRISMALVAWRLKESSENKETLRWNLPYEMIIVAVLK